MLEEQTMTITKHPKDSILKRHFDATVEMKRQIWLQNPPTDSILHRHAMSVSHHPAVRPNIRIVRDTPTSSVNRSASATASRQVNEKKKGLFSWLFGLFRNT
jgi:hypothetical protein